MTDNNDFKILINGLKDIYGDDEERQKAVLEEQEREERKEIELFRRRSKMPKKFLSATIESDKYTSEQKALLDNFKSIIQLNGGGFFILFGNVGVGKTYTACALLNSVRFGRYIDMPELRLELQASDRWQSQRTRQEVLHYYANCRLLVIDEIGRFMGRIEEEQEVLFYLINKRYENNLPTVLCSNFTYKEFAEFAGAAVTDRIKDCNYKMTFGAQSLR